jgi:anti-sigma B factor antagonist
MHSEVHEAPGFTVDAENRTGVVLVTVEGDLDMDSSDALYEEAAEAMERADDGSRLVLDLSGVEFADSSGLTALVKCCRLTPGRPPVLLGARNVVTSPLATTGLDVLFELQSTYEITAPHVIDLRHPPEDT